MSNYFSTYEHLSFSRPRPGVLLLTLNRPEARNAMNSRLHTEVAEVWHDIGRDDDTNVVVVTGAGRAFSIGGDPDELSAEQPGAEQAVRSLSEVTHIVRNMLDCDRVIIAAINGAAAAGGLALALSADITLVAEDAKLIDPHVLGGLAAGDHAALLWPLLCGMAKTKFYVLAGQVLDGREAERIGLVSQCLPAAELLPRALDLAANMAAGSQPAIRFSKRALNGWFQQAMPIFEHSVALEMLTLLHPDAVEGMRAAAARSRPQFPSARRATELGTP